MKKNYKFTCEFCGKHFVREHNYLKHMCKEMKRYDEVEHTVIGQAAWTFYKQWMNKNGRQARNLDAFVTSSFYNAFIKFAKFVKETKVPDPDQYMWFMMDKKYRPIVWTEDVPYREYLEFVDLQGDPYDRAAYTIKALQRISKEQGCNLRDVFDHMTAPEMVHRIYIRELSPWFLLNSVKFLALLKRSDRAEQQMLDNVIRPGFWRDRFQKNPDAHKDLKIIVKRLNL